MSEYRIACMRVALGRFAFLSAMMLGVVTTMVV